MSAIPTPLVEPVLTTQPTIWRPDVTVATVVERDGRFLFVEEIVHGRAVLNQPAGHLEDGESLMAGALRETLEETAWSVAIEHFLGFYQWKSPNDGRTFMRCVFFAKPIEHHKDAKLDDGIVASHWLSRDELLAFPVPARSPLVLAAVDAHLRGVRFPLDVLNFVTSDSPAVLPP